MEGNNSEFRELKVYIIKSIEELKASLHDLQASYEKFRSDLEKRLAALETEQKISTRWKILSWNLFVALIGSLVILLTEIMKR